MAGTHPKIDQRFLLTRRIPFVHIISSQLELQRSRHPVMCLKLVVSRLLPMLMQIDEPWRYYEPTRLNVPPAR